MGKNLKCRFSINLIWKPYITACQIGYIHSCADLHLIDCCGKGDAVLVFNKINNILRNARKYWSLLFWIPIKPSCGHHSHTILYNKSCGCFKNALIKKFINFSSLSCELGIFFIISCTHLLNILVYCSEKMEIIINENDFNFNYICRYIRTNQTYNYMHINYEAIILGWFQWKLYLSKRKWLN